jgi:hypothetical protein
MNRALSCALLAAGIATAAPAEAQHILPFSVEARAGTAAVVGSLPTGGDEGISAARGGLGYGANVAYHVLPLLSVYGGWDRYQFRSLILVNGVSVKDTYVDQGFSVGGRSAVPVAALLGVSPWVRAGALFRTLELSRSGTRSPRSTGFEAGAGLDIPLGLPLGLLSLTPGISYRAYPADLGADTGKEDTKYVDFSLGLKARI